MVEKWVGIEIGGKIGGRLEGLLRTEMILLVRKVYGRVGTRNEGGFTRDLRVGETKDRKY